MTTYADPLLNYWGDRFAAAHLEGVMTFEEFMALAPALRERRVAQSAVLPQPTFHRDLRRLDRTWLRNHH